MVNNWPANKKLYERVGLIVFSKLSVCNVEKKYYSSTLSATNFMKIVNVIFGLTFL